jgi:hypothetical protein
MSRIDQLKNELARRLTAKPTDMTNNSLASAIVSTLAPFLNLDKQEEEWPRFGQSYYCIDSWGDVCQQERLEDDRKFDYRKASNSIFRTRAEAEAQRDAILAGTVRVVVEKVSPRPTGDGGEKS